MMEHDNIQLIKEHFVAFWRGDIQGALNIVALNVDWQSPVTKTQSEKSPGRSYEHDWVMVFTLRDGKIIKHRHYYDTADVAVACRK